jgi:hypothetical protein
MTKTSFLKPLINWMLISLCAVIFAAMWFGFIILAHRWAPKERIIDCSFAEIHPDFSPKAREACRINAMHKMQEAQAQALSPSEIDEIKAGAKTSILMNSIHAGKQIHRQSELKG